MSKSFNDCQVKTWQPFLIRAWNFFSPDHENETVFSLEKIISAATKRCGFSNFGDQAYLEGLASLLDSFRNVKTYHPFGRLYVRQLIIEMLVHRLRLIDLLQCNPEILSERIINPVFILGLPRSGTTLMFNLLAQDSAHRSMANWEAFIAQVPPAGQYTYANDPRKNKAKWMLRFQKYLMPEIDKKHEFTYEGPEECTSILMQSFATQTFVGSFDVPKYSEWLDHADHNPTYEHHKQVLQTLQWKYPGHRWLLKSPDHLAALPSILKVYPDARFIHIHRDPISSVSSWASLNLTYRGVYYHHVNTEELGQQVLERLSNDLNNYVLDRESSPKDQFYDISYSDFLLNPLKTVEKIYSKFGFELSEQAESKMKAYIQASPANKHGAHKYNPKDYGLSEDLIRQKFSIYLNAYKVYLDDKKISYERSVDGQR